MGKVLILQNAPLFTGGSFEAELERREIPFEYHKVFESGVPPLEGIGQYSGVIVLGGPLKFRVDQVEKSPLLQKEVFYLSACLDQHKPIFGVGQGGNLLAKAQGASLTRMKAPEIGWVKAEIYPDYSRNSVIYSKVEEKKFSAFVWQDTINGFPPKGYWYVYSPNCRHISTGIHGNCYLFNFHPEVTEELVESWLKEYKKDLPSNEAAQKIREQTKENMEFTLSLSRKIIHGFQSFL